jgi:hypothetical protein
MPSTFKIQGVFKIQGALSTTYGSPDLVAWVKTLKTNSLTLPSDTVLSALEALIRGLQNTGLRSKILRLNLFCGGDYISSFFPIIKDVGLTWDYNGIYGSTVSSLANGPFQAADWSISTGFNAANNANYVSSGNVIGNTNTNTLKVIDTTFAGNNSNINNYSVHLATYISGINAGSAITNITDIGTTAYFNMQAGFNGNNASNIIRSNIYAQTTQDTATYTYSSLFSPQGFYVSSRTSTTSNTIYKNGSAPSAANNPNTQTALTTPPTSTTSFILFGRPTTSNAGPGAANKAITNVTDRTVSMYSIGSGLTNTDVANYNNLISTFNTAIGRTNF